MRPATGQNHQTKPMQVTACCRSVTRDCWAPDSCKESGSRCGIRTRPWDPERFGFTGPNDRCHRVLCTLRRRLSPPTHVGVAAALLRENALLRLNAAAGCCATAPNAADGRCAIAPKCCRWLLRRCAEMPPLAAAVPRRIVAVAAALLRLNGCRGCRATAPKWLPWLPRYCG